MANNGECHTVYMHIFPNGKKYIGQTKMSMLKRGEKGGRGYLTKKNGKYLQPLMAYAILKYGWNNVKHVVLAKVNTVEESNMLERFYIALYDSASRTGGYNMLLGGDAYNINYKRTLSPEVRKKLSEAKKGKPLPHLHNDTVRKKISIALTGYKHSDEFRKKCSQRTKGQVPWNKGKKATAKARYNQSLGHKGYHWYTDGINNTQSRECPEGMHPGRTFNWSNK